LVKKNKVGVEGWGACFRERALPGDAWKIPVVGGGGGGREEGQSSCKKKKGQGQRRGGCVWSNSIGGGGGRRARVKGLSVFPVGGVANRRVKRNQVRRGDRPPKFYAPKPTSPAAVGCTVEERTGN